MARNLPKIPKRQNKRFPGMRKPPISFPNFKPKDIDNTEKTKDPKNLI